MAPVFFRQRIARLASVVDFVPERGAKTLERIGGEIEVVELRLVRQDPRLELCLADIPERTPEEVRLVLQNVPECAEVDAVESLELQQLGAGAAAVEIRPVLHFEADAADIERKRNEGAST